MGSLRGKGGRFLLLIGDDGAIFGRLDGQKLAEAWFCPHDKLEEGRALFAKLLASRKAAPLLVLADLLEQMYREDQLPKVGPLDEAKLLRRRLDMAFPGDACKGVLKLGADAKGGQKILMAVLAESKALAGWSEFLEGLANPITGYCLQPLEAVDLLTFLMPESTGKERHWRALIGLQATGGLRQIFTVGGKLVITRLTQAPDDAAALASTIERELRSSISYLKRLGYNETERLDLTVIGDEALCAEIRERELAVSSLLAFTPSEAAGHLGLRGAAKVKDGYSDLLLAEWAALRKKPILVLPTPALDARNRLRRALRLGRVAAVAATAGVVLLLGGLASYSYQAGLLADSLEAELQPQAPVAASSADALPLPADDMRRAAAQAEQWAKERIDLAGLVAALPADAGQRKVAFSANPKDTDHKLPPAKWEMAVSYDLGPKTPLEEQVNRIRDLKAKLATAFPGCRVLVTRLPLGLQASQVLEGSLGQGGAQPDRDALLVLTVRKES
jgi:hypothetical protein